MKKLLFVLTAMLLGLGAPAHAQIPGINLNLGARAGVFMPISTLAETPQGDVKLKQGLGFGASLELDIPLSPINVRANVEAAMGAKLEVDGIELDDNEVNIVSITGDLVFRPLPRIVVVQPYLLAGGGIKKYEFDGAFPVPGDRSRWTGHVGAGVDLKVGPIALLAEVNDYISTFKYQTPTSEDSKLQNDVFVTVGFRIGML